LITAENNLFAFILSFGLKYPDDLLSIALKVTRRQPIEAGDEKYYKYIRSEKAIIYLT
jgi:hypothetical protein